MPLDLVDYGTKAREAVKAFWGNRAAAVAKQKELGREDQGERAGVTGGKNMDGVHRSHSGPDPRQRFNRCSHDDGAARPHPPTTSYRIRERCTLPTENSPPAAGGRRPPKRIGSQRQGLWLA